MPATAATTDSAPLLNKRYLASAVAALCVMTWAIAASGLWFLNFVHVFSGLLWTGIDLFMGFVIGPGMRRMELPARRQLVTHLMPRMLYLMPTLAIITGTTGWFMAERMGFLALPYPTYGWVLAALVIIGVLTAQGLGILLPINIRVYKEIRKARPDVARIGPAMRFYLRIVAVQGLLQIAIIVIMAHFATGL